MFYPIGGGHQLSEAGEDQNAKDRDDIFMLVTGLGENAVSIDELAREKKVFFSLHANGTGVTANDNVTWMLKRELPFTLDVLHMLLGQNPECLQPKINFTQYPACSETSKIP